MDTGEPLSSEIAPHSSATPTVEMALDAPAAVDVILISPGDKKIQVIKIIRLATGLGLADATNLVERAPSVLEGLNYDRAHTLVAELEAVGASIELT